MPQLTIDELAARPTLSVREFYETLGIGRTIAYRLVRDGEVPVIRWGRTIRVPTPYVLDLLNTGNVSPSGEPTGGPSSPRDSRIAERNLRTARVCASTKGPRLAAVAAEFNVSRATAARYVRAAREAGLLESRSS